ncbi:MAG TPA: hypothetical protein VGK07_04420 [Candidatus Limnocylindria bacterium]|jgi:hypothetical protein
MIRDARVRLFLTSATLLFVELLLIRWVPANVVYVGVAAIYVLAWIARPRSVFSGEPVMVVPPLAPAPQR